MKTLILAIITLTTLSANASSIFMNCSNSSGSITKSMGGISITKRTCAGRSHRCEDTKIKLDHSEINLEILNEVEIDSKVTRSCSEGRRSGFWSSHTVFSQKIVITKNDGSEFTVDSDPRNPSRILDVSSDKLKIEGYIICEKFISSMIMCEQ